MTSKKCWVGNLASPSAKSRKMAAADARHNDVLRPLVPKGEDRNTDLYTSMYGGNQLLGSLDPVTAQLQYSLAMRPFLTYSPTAASAGHMISPYLSSFPQLLMHSGKSPVVACKMENDKGSGDEKENKLQQKEESDTTEDVATDANKEEVARESNGTGEEKREAVKKVLEIVDATVSQQQHAESDKNQLSKLGGLSALASAAAAAIIGSESLACRYCQQILTSPVELHQHERYLCVCNRSSPPPNMQLPMHQTDIDDCGSDDGHSCRVRSILSDEQKRVLEAQYAENPWPGKNDMERLAADTCLARRVIQVWFQNCRARDRRKGKTVPERPVGVRAATCTTPELPRAPVSVPYIPRVPQVPVRPPTFYPTPPPAAAPADISFIQVEPLDLSNKSSGSTPPPPSDQVLNLSTKPSVELMPQQLFKYLPTQNGLAPEEPTTPLINMTPAHSTPRTTPDRPPPPPPPPRSSPAIFPSMLSSPQTPVTAPSPPPSSLESSFSSSSDGTDRRDQRRRSWKQVRHLIDNFLAI